MMIDVAKSHERCGTGSREFSFNLKLININEPIHHLLPPFLPVATPPCNFQFPCKETDKLGCKAAEFLSRPDREEGGDVNNRCRGIGMTRCQTDWNNQSHSLEAMIRNHGIKPGMEGLCDVEVFTKWQGTRSKTK